MPEDSKKNHDKKRGDPKDQRKPRQRHQQSGSEKKAEKKTEEPKNVPKVTAPQKPAYEAPPPEFFKNLKRETDEILKITEEENAKYKKKEIQSNWSKYEMPIDSYEEIEEQENLGADYEKLIQAPLSIGGHFQFKHEKSWDMNTGPSLYDKYFDINMEELNIALCSIPFYERNSIEEATFSQTDILTMNNRATRFKQKYYNDKSYSTPEIEAQDKILNSLRNSMKEDNEKDTSHDTDLKYDKERKTSETENASVINLEFSQNKSEIKTRNVPVNVFEENVPKPEDVINETKTNIPPTNIENKIEHEDLLFGNTNEIAKAAEVTMKRPSITEELNVGSIQLTPVDKVIPSEVPKMVPAAQASKVADTPAVAKINPVIETPEDLEKWLDDFLDG